MKKSAFALLSGVVACTSVAASVGLPTIAQASEQTVTLAETGSSLLYPLFNGQWVPAYNGLHPNVQITSAATGSGTGISQSIAGTVQIGASDAYLADEQMKATPTMVNIPLAISAQQVMYHIPGLKASQHLKLSGNVLGQIYEGKIKMWDDSSIAKMNKGVKLPHKQIVPVRRSDGSGDTFLFTQFLSDTNTAWKNSVAYGTTVSWPAVRTEVGAKGNDGVVAVMQSTPYSVGYVGISWLDNAVKDGLGYAALQNRAGQFVLPTQSNIQTAANALVKQVPKDERISLIYAPGKTAYPIINFEYAIINTKQPSQVVAPLKQFLQWAINDKWGGNKASFLKPVHFLPLPSSVKPLSEAQIANIGK